MVKVSVAGDAARDNASWRFHSRLFGYVLRQLGVPLLFTLAGFTLVLLVTDLVGYADLLVNRGFGPAEVANLAFQKLLPALASTLPFALLIGSLVALGRLGADREILVMEASGFSPRNLMGPVLASAGVLFVLGLYCTTIASPRAHRTFAETLAEMARRNPSTAVQPGRVSVFGDWRLEAKEVSAGGEHLSSVILHSPELGDTVFAQQAELAPDGNGDLNITLDRGVLLSATSSGASLVRFGRMQERLPRNGGRESLASDLARIPFSDLSGIASSDPDPRRSRRAEVEWHRRLALPLASLVFGLLAVPLFLRFGTLSRSGGAALGMVVVGLYYVFVQIGNALLRYPSVPVSLAVWIPNAVGLAIAVGLVSRIDSLSTTGRDRLRKGARPRSSASRRSAGRFVLDRYVLRQFVAMAALCVLVLLVAYLLVDVVDNLQWFAKYQSTASEVLRYYGARLPVLASRVIPLGLFVGAAVTLNLLAVHGELVAFRACGVSTLRVELPMLLLCSVLTLLYYPFANELVPRSNALASHLKRTEIKDRGTAASFWRRVGDRVYEAESFDPLQGVAGAMTLYELDDDGLPRSRTDASRALHVGEGRWRLEEPTRYDVTGFDLVRGEGDAFVELGTDVEAEVETAHLTPGRLRREIEQLESGGYDAGNFHVDLQVKLAAPVACLVLPALALLYAASGPPFPTPIQTLIASVFGALLYLGAVSVGAALGYGGSVPPRAAAWGPMGLLALVALGLVLRMRRRGQWL
jgi:LPS export ABC transporter permease LptG